MGYTGYRDQLERARRSLKRMEAATNEVEFQDLVWTFFQNCWLVKDWMKHDPLVPQSKKDAVKAMAHKSDALTACQQMCNGTKHLGLRGGAKHEYVEMQFDKAGQPVEMDCILDNVGGKPVSGRALAHECIAEWERILNSQALATRT